MTVSIYVRTSDLEYLHKVIKDIDALKEPIDASSSPLIGSLMVSIDYDDYVRLNDLHVFSILISL